jgi:hypothetical protein
MLDMVIEGDTCATTYEHAMLLQSYQTSHVHPVFWFLGARHGTGRRHVRNDLRTRYAVTELQTSHVHPVRLSRRLGCIQRPRRCA